MSENKIPKMPKIRLTNKQIIRKKELLKNEVKQINLEKTEGITNLLD